VKSSDRTILLVLGCVALVAAFWFLVLGPKRQEASDLQDQVTTLQSDVAQQEAVASTATQAKTDFKSNYRQLVTLGKAVPVDSDTPSLLTQLESLSAKADVDFRSIQLGGNAGAAGGGGAVAPAPVTPTATVGTATEASASLLPIGATVGSAGLPIMPYQLEFEGDFFDIADFFGEIDGLVDLKGDEVSVNGRLMTINDFTLSPTDDKKGTLSAALDVTTFLTPADQGVTAGATPTGPLATPVPATTPSTTAPVQPAVVGQ
jgi:Tfp pilus assembly protein PilO